MPLKNGRITPQEKLFVERYAATGDAAYAAEKAGYGTPAVRGSELKSKAALQPAIRAEMSVRLDRIVPLALARWERDIQDPGTSTRDSILIGKEAIRAWRALQQDSEEKDISEMSLPELQRRAAALEAQAQALRLGAMTIEGEIVEKDQPAAPGVFD